MPNIDHFILKYSVVDGHGFDADQEPDFHFDADPHVEK